MLLAGVRLISEGDVVREKDCMGLHLFNKAKDFREIITLSGHIIYTKEYDSPTSWKKFACITVVL